MTTAQLRSLDDLHSYAQELASRRVDDDPVVRKMHTAKQATWLFLQTCAFLFYYLIDKMQDALMLL